MKKMNPIVVKTAYNVYAPNPPVYEFVCQGEVAAIPEPFVKVYIGGERNARETRIQKMSPRQFYETYDNLHLRWECESHPAWQPKIGSYDIITKIVLEEMEEAPNFIFDCEPDCEMTFHRFTRKRERTVSRATLARAFGEDWVKRLEAYKFSLCEKNRRAKERGEDRIN